MQYNTKNKLKILWLCDSWNKPEYNHWFKIDFVKYLKDNFNLNILVYGKNSYENYPNLSPIIFSDNKTIQDIKKEFNFDLIVIDSYNRNKQRSFDNIFKFPIIYIEGDLHSHINNPDYINWINKLEPTFSLYRHKSNLVKANKFFPFNQFKNMWFPCSVDTNIFKPNNEIKKINKIFFMGTIWNTRKKYLECLKNNGLIDIFESKTKKQRQKYSSYFYIKILQKYLVGFNHSGGSGENVDNAKMFEIMACGGILFTNECNNGVKELFPEGSYLTYPNLSKGLGRNVSVKIKWERFKNIIIDKTNFLINNPEEVKKITNKALKCIKTKHTHEIRGNEFIRVINEIL